MLKLILAFICLLNITCSNDLGPEPEQVIHNEGQKPEKIFIQNKSDPKDKAALLNSSTSKTDVSEHQLPHNQDVEKSKGNNVTHINKSDEKNNSMIPILVRPNVKNNIIQSGALLRGFYVFLGLSVITVMYFLFKSYRLRNGGQPFTMIHKYGVVARRSDMEMRPLELDDDEDDNTLFEINSRSNNH